MAKDANDLLQEAGPSALRSTIDQAPTMKDATRNLEIGSDNEVAQRVADDIRAQIGELVHAEGNFFVWKNTHWAILHDEELFKFIQAYDGRGFASAMGTRQRYSLTKSRRDSVSDLLRRALRQRDFFHDAPVGVACRSGFIALNQSGEASLVAHNRDQRQRHLIDAEWSDQVWKAAETGSLLHTLISGCFDRDEHAYQHSQLLGEMLGAAAFGLGTRIGEPKAIVLLGESAGNGKSQCLEMLRGLLPGHATAAVAPIEMSKEQRRAQLAGVTLNAVDELGIDAIRSDTFKTVITGDRTSGKHVYKEPFEFYPIALHALAANDLPAFSEGLDRGIRRRVIILPFERTIPRDERIPHIGLRAAREETDAILAMAVDGARRLLKNGGFTESPLGKAKLTEWVILSDPVAAFFQDEDVILMTGKPEDMATSKQTYLHFKTWAKCEGLSDAQLPPHQKFTLRVKQLSLKRLRITRSGKSGTRFIGIQLVGKGR